MGTGQKEGMIKCNPVNSMDGDRYLWYFRNNSDESMDRQLMVGTNKYVMDDVRRTLTVKNVTFNDEGLYYCRLMRNNEQVPGACLRVYSK